ncbi:Outer membrane protein P1 [Thalassocella blandensis]|nr:Outer membrane protein P1 [Thalassocella blandensis]
MLKNRKSFPTVLSITGFTALIAVPFGASASSIQILEQSPAHLGKAFAGTASDINEASTVFFNPAGMTQFDEAMLSVGINALYIQSEFNDSGSNTGGDAGETDKPGYVPNLYYLRPLGDKWALGLGVNGPFGLASSYDRNWQGRYLATDSELSVANIDANLAYEFSDKFSAAIGVSYQKLDVTLENQVDSTLGVMPDPSTDSRAKITGDDTAFVLNLSAHYQVSDSTSLGVAWRQGGEFDISGDAQFELNAACAPGEGYPTGAPPAPTTGTLCAGALGARAGHVETKVELPDTLTLSASHRLNDQWTLHGDIASTQWSSIDVIEIMQTENEIVVDTLDLQYDNTMRYAIGVTYANESPWTWRAGFAMDEAPQTDPSLVTPRIPDQDRTWLSAGFNYAQSEAFSVDVGFAHLLVDDTEISNTDTTTGHLVSGTFESSVNILSIQGNWKI